MTGPLIYPGADTHSQWVGDGTVTMAMDNVKWGQHSTETAGGWPGYSEMGDAPTFTFEPWLHQLRQHFRVNESARAFRNDTYPTVNHQDIVQMEISCYCDRSLAQSVGRMDRYIDAIDDQAINQLGDFGAWLEKYWGMKPNFYPAALNWPSYNGQQTVRRLSWAAYVNFSGVLGHMAVPGQIHLDPSSLNNLAIKARMQAGAKPPWPMFRETSPAVRSMVAKLDASGFYHSGHRDKVAFYGHWTRLAITNLQLAHDDTKADPDGLIGERTWAHMQALPGAPQDPPAPPEHESLLEKWQHATGDAVHAGQAFVEEQPNRPALRSVLTSQQEDWATIHEAATP